MSIVLIKSYFLANYTLRDIEFDGKYFYTCDMGNNLIKKYDPNFVLIKDYNLGGVSPNGITFDGKNFYVLNDNVSTLGIYDSNFQLIKTSGVLANTYRDCATDGKYIYMTFGSNVVKYDKNFVIIKLFGVGIDTRGITFDGKYFYIIHSDQNRQLVKFDSDFVEIDREPIPNGYGLCFDGKYIYVATTSTWTVYKYMYNY